MSISSLSRIAATVLVVLALAACSDSASEGGHEEAQDGAGTAHSSSSAGLPGGRLAAGEELAHLKRDATGQSCIDCHGADGNEPIDPTYPKLGGQYRDYLGQALLEYREGAREQALMSTQAQGLSDQQIADLAVYFASRPGQLRDLQGAH